MWGAELGVHSGPAHSRDPGGCQGSGVGTARTTAVVTDSRRPRWSHVHRKQDGVKGIGTMILKRLKDGNQGHIRGPVLGTRVKAGDITDRDHKKCGNSTKHPNFQHKELGVWEDPLVVAGPILDFEKEMA